MANLGIKDLRMRRVLLDKKRELGSYVKLEKAIAAANGGLGVDRRKLKSLLEDDDVYLRLQDLVRLDNYLARFGEGLSARPLFEQPDILTSLSESEGLGFLFGAYPRADRRRTDIARWDVRSVAQVVRDVNRYSGSTHFEIEDVIPRDPEEADRDADGASERWRRWVRDETSLVCVGSPRACRATEVTLAKMFEQTPFSPHVRSELALPFHFVWCRNERPHGSTSRFADHGDSIRDRCPKLTKRLDKGDYRVTALMTASELYTVEQKDKVGERWIDYGITAVQRRARGGIWVALCGLSGPSTYAGARLLRHFKPNILRPRRVGEHSAIMWAVVEAEVELIDLPGDNRAVVAERICAGPHYWDPVRGAELVA